MCCYELSRCLLLSPCKGDRFQQFIIFVIILLLLLLLLLLYLSEHHSTCRHTSHTVAKRAQHALRYVALPCCDRLAGALRSPQTSIQVVVRRHQNEKQIDQDS